MLLIATWRNAALFYAILLPRGTSAYGGVAPTTWGNDLAAGYGKKLKRNLKEIPLSRMSRMSRITTFSARRFWWASLKVDESNAAKASYIIVWQLVRGNSYLMYRLAHFFYSSRLTCRLPKWTLMGGMSCFEIISKVEKVRRSEANDANFRMSDLHLAGRRLLAQGCLCNNQQSRNATRRMPVVRKLSFLEL